MANLIAEIKDNLAVNANKWMLVRLDNVSQMTQYLSKSTKLDENKEE